MWCSQYPTSGGNGSALFTRPQSESSRHSCRKLRKNVRLSVESKKIDWSRKVMTASAAITLFKNVRIFNGATAQLSPPSFVLVRSNRIEKISKTSISVEGEVDVCVLDGAGRTLMPGLIDNHWHAMLVRSTPTALMADDLGYTNLAAGVEATDTLMRGFTTVRDVGGPAFGLKRAIDEGLVAGPRIYPSGAMISITGGHGDFRQTHEVPRRVGGAL